jgi:hypothetical protein
MANDSILLLTKNYNDAVKHAHVCGEAWKAAGRPWNCQVKTDYDNACESSRVLLVRLSEALGNGKPSLVNGVPSFVSEAIHASRE